MLQIAVIGAGPSGFYAANAVLRRFKDARVDLIDRLPTPYGLVRSGVAPDHQITKRAKRVFDRIATNPRFSFFGHVECGKDVSLAELRALYDGTILAVGAENDRKLGLPGENLPGIYGSGQFSGWYNGHPDCALLDPDLQLTKVVVIGNGNVALDIARVLLKTPEEMRLSDLAPPAGAAISASPIEEVAIIGRRGPMQSRFTYAELHEIGSLAQTCPVVDAPRLEETVFVGDENERQLRLAQRAIEIFRAFATRKKQNGLKHVSFHFGMRPIEFLGSRRLEAVRFMKMRPGKDAWEDTGEMVELPCGLAVKAIGYQSRPIKGAPFDKEKSLFPSKEGRVEPGLFVVGWAMRGSSGVIGTSKRDGEQVALRIEEDCQASGRKGGVGLATLLEQRGIFRVDYKAWQRIEAAEMARGTPPRKFLTIEELLHAATISDAHHE